MKFMIERVSKNGGRLGILSQLSSQPGVTHNTPFTLVATAGGSPHHLTQDVFHMVASNDIPLCVPAQYFYPFISTLQAYKKGVASFSALQGHSVCVTVHDPTILTPSGYNEKKGVSTWTSQGRKIFTSESYMELVEALGPDWYEPLCDADTPNNAPVSKKRFSKAAAASKTYITHCLKLHKEMKSLQDVGMLMPLLGGHSKEERVKWSKWVLEQGMTVCGFSLLGLHTNGPDVERLKAETVCHLVKASLETQPSDLPRQASGAWNPLTLLGLVGEGVDIFDSTFPNLVTERSGALIFPHQLSGSNESNLEHQDKKIRTDSPKSLEEGSTQEPEEGNDKQTEATTNDEVDSDNSTVTSPYEINVKDKRYREVLEPLVKGCECYTCRTFTTAYLHHLATVKELLAPVLLSIHNLHHWLGFFSSIREAIQTDRLPDLQQLIKTSISTHSIKDHSTHTIQNNTTET